MIYIKQCALSTFKHDAIPGFAMIINQPWNISNQWSQSLCLHACFTFNDLGINCT